MLIFIIPLKSAKATDSWDLVSRLFERTIRSICNQTCPEFKVIVVCHEKPDINFTHANVFYTSVDFPIPTWEADTDNISRETDKTKKIFVGLSYARQFNPTHVMFVDADDCVNKHLAEFVSQNPESNGWVFAQGYEYANGNNSILLRKKGFNYRCGTSSIVKYDIIALDNTMEIDDIDYIWLYHGKKIENQLLKKGSKLGVLPFPGAVYITNHGENMVNQINLRLQRAKSIYQKLRVYLISAGKLLLSQPLTDSIREEFSLYDLQDSSRARHKSNLVAR
ncbi:glycosyltransferase family 2 protein [Pleurocapsales cyanobacterium LEGE 10410]|nr:glycosyltransferase family 2 protein [Pleurocapsales cyanobacterium LEGE 10410]